MHTGWIYTLLERAVFLEHLLGAESVSGCERSMALEWPAGFIKSSDQQSQSVENGLGRQELQRTMGRRNRACSWSVCSILLIPNAGDDR
jgi:hypothetical protein